MAFTFNADLSTDLDMVRFHISDIEAGKGPLPFEKNIDDATITALLTEKGSIECAVAALFDMLEASWVAHPKFGVGEFASAHADIARGYAFKAAAWHAKCHGGDTRRVKLHTIDFDDEYSLTEENEWMESRLS